MEEALTSIRKSASWFYWIAGLSIVNIISMAMESDYSMVLGLGITQVAQGLAQAMAGDQGPVIATILYGITISAALVFAGLGWQANKLAVWPFVVGMILYAIDGSIFIFFEDIIGLVFHVFVLFMLFGGFSTLRKVRKVEELSSF